MSDWNQQVSPWSHPSDAWAGRSYIGDDVELEVVEDTEKRIACFYDSDGEKEEFDLSDLSSEDEEENNEEKIVNIYPRVRLRRTKKGFFYMIVARH